MALPHYGAVVFHKTRTTVTADKGLLPGRLVLQREWTTTGRLLSAHKNKPLPNATLGGKRISFYLAHVQPSACTAQR